MTVPVMLCSNQDKLANMVKGASQLIARSKQLPSLSPVSLCTFKFVLAVANTSEDQSRVREKEKELGVWGGGEVREGGFMGTITQPLASHWRKATHQGSTEGHCVIVL